MSLPLLLTCPPTAHNSNNNSGGRNNRGVSGNNNHGGRNRGRGGQSHHQQHGMWNQPSQQPWAYPPWAYPPWVTPPCPYPTLGNWQQPAALNCRPDILGQRPQQAHVTSAQPSYTPTDI